MPTPFETCFTAQADDIDIMGHVNNAVWVRWMEAIATAHWMSLAPPETVARFAWVVTRHEIDYKGNVALGEVVTARTFIPDPPRGARLTGGSISSARRGSSRSRHARAGP